MTASVIDRVRDRVMEIPVGGFVHTRDVVESVATPSTRSAVDVAMHRLRDEASLVKVRPGLYYRGKPTRFGPTRPDPYLVGLEVASAAGYADGVGPAGFSAARMFGLTTQVPSFTEISVPGRAPADLRTVHFASRSAVARRGLTPVEVAILEVLRNWGLFSETAWSMFVDRVSEAVSRGDVVPDRLRKAAHRERHAAARSLTDRLLEAVDRSGEPAGTSQ